MVLIISFPSAHAGFHIPTARGHGPEPLTPFVGHSETYGLGRLMTAPRRPCHQLDQRGHNTCRKAAVWMVLGSMAVVVVR